MRLHGGRSRTIVRYKKEVFLLGKGQGKLCPTGGPVGALEWRERSCAAAVNLALGTEGTVKGRPLQRLGGVDRANEGDILSPGEIPGKP